MRSSTWRLEDLKTTIFNLGFVGENEHKQLRIDCKEMFGEYPTASPSLTVSPPEGESYPAVIERDGDFVIWTITDSDLIHEGSGEVQLSFTVSEVVAKSYIGRFRVGRSIMPTGEIPEGIDDFLTRAGAALTAIPQTIDEALEEAKASGEFDGPAGPAGQDGTDGYSPTATVVKSGKTATITITDKNGTTTAQISDGEGGGTSDYSDLENKPQIAGVTLSGNVSLHDLGAAAESDIPDPTSIIDDTAGDGDTDKVWSADKTSELLSEITNGTVKAEKTYAKVINNKKRRPLMTFIDDDACSEFADIWPAICREKNIRVNCAVISGSVGNDTHLSWGQIESMHSEGIVEFVNHTNAQESIAGIEKSVVYERVMHCKNALAEHGINTGDILVYPYGGYDESCIDVMKGICRCGITTDQGSTVSTNVPPVRTFALWRNELVETTASANPTLAWMKSVVDAAKSNNAWVIWMSHSQYAGFDADAIANIKALIDYSVEQGVDIVTASEALDIYGNAFETGDYKNNGLANGFVVGCDGTTYGRGADFEEIHNKYLFVTPPKVFPRCNMLASYISGYYGVGFPSDGVMLSVIAPTTASEYTSESYQIFKSSSANKNDIYTRGFATDGLPNVFKLITQKSGASTDRPKHVAKGYCYFDTTLGKPIFADADAQHAWYKLTITAGTTSAGSTKFAGKSISLDAGLTKQQVRDALIDELCSLTYTSSAGVLVYFTPQELGFEDDGVSLYLMNKNVVNYTTALWVDPVAPDNGCRGTFTRLRDGVLPGWVDATGASV